MTDAAATLSVTSFLHGERVWQRVGEREHVRRDGRQTTLARWRSSCTICGEAFEVSTPRGVKTVEESKRFTATTCPSHRLTPSEVAELRFAKRDERRAVFEALKRSKLATPIAPPAPSAPPSRTQSPVRASAPIAGQPYSLNSREGRERAERILQFRAEHRDQAAKAIASEMRKAQEDEEDDDRIRERLESFQRPKPALRPN